MKLHEFQSKQLFARYGIPISKGKVASSPEEARAVAKELGKPVVVKAQVLVGGRGKAGGIRLARTPEEAEQIAEQILSMTLRGLPVRRVLVDEAVEIQAELYLGLVIDRARRRVVAMASSAGGVDIEEVARTAPEKIVRVVIEPELGLREYQARTLAAGIGLDRALWASFTQIALALYRCFEENDATLSEINPLAVVPGPALLALDGKMIIDDNALFRHPDLAAIRDEDEETLAEREARKYGISYVKLDGSIGCMVNGAGLAMATMDIIQLFGGRPANFLDIGGGASAERVAAAMRLILSDPNVKAVLINIFGGITRCDEVARGILAAFDIVRPRVPVVVRLVGTNEEEGRAILQGAHGVALHTVTTLVEAAQQAVRLAGDASHPE